MIFWIGFYIEKFKKNIDNTKELLQIKYLKIRLNLKVIIQKYWKS